MTLKQFNLDIKEAASKPCHGVSNIQRGDSEGEVIFTYTPEDQDPVELQALATDVDSYPRGSSFLIVTLSEHVDKALMGFLQGAAERVPGQNVAEVIRLLSTKLATKLKATLASTPDEQDDFIDTDGIECDSGFDDDDFSDMDEDYDIELDPSPSRALASSHLPVVDTRDSLRRLKRHLRQTSEAGFFLSIMAADLKSQASGIFSIATRVSQLNISEEALEAWDLKNADHIVLLVRFPMGYPDTTELLALPSEQSAIQFRLGKCASPRPSISSVQAAYGLADVDRGGRKEPQHADSPNKKGDADLFCPLLVSKSLNLLLNQEFISLLGIRRQQKLSWDEAQSYHFNRRRGDHRRTQSREIEILDEGLMKRDETHTTPGDLKWLPHDYALDEDDDLNVFLAALQFSLQRLIRCTKYCMVCHRRTDETFEAVRPYVCSNPLCLYQYMALGFGHSIEHEIINNPYVVDLLVSFFYSAVSENRLREFPSGLNLKYPYTGTIQAPAEHLIVDVCFATKTIRFSVNDYASYSKITEGSFVLLVVKNIETIVSYSIMTGGLERHSCIIESVQNNVFTFKIVSTVAGTSNPQPTNIVKPANQATYPSEAWKEVVLFKHDKDIEELEDRDRNVALMLMTHNIPSVLDMRNYLMTHPGSFLSSWKQMDTSTLTLLSWIVASNRSFIVQDVAIPNSNQPSGEGTSPETGNQVGLEPHWLQFRFAQGSPEKEEKFCQALSQNECVEERMEQFPSLFAWHGSPLGNWHSIIRTGLDFATSIHGRAYGNGVYLSSDFSVSLGYVGSMMAVNHISGLSDCWPNSQLNVRGAISLCEVVNEPSKFVSSSPHFVVDKVEWIQCRYLFVNVSPKQSTISQLCPKPMAHEIQYLDQDPKRQLRGSKGSIIQVPQSAIPVGRRLAWGQAVSQVAKTIQPGLETGIWQDKKDDVDMFLDSEDEDGLNCTVRRRRLSGDSGMEEARPSKLTTTMQDAKINCPGPDGSLPNSAPVTEFQPGSLDHDTVPKLLEPTWASSSPSALRCLSKEIKELQRIQAKSDLRSLGWYIDFDKLSNLFHWIVELHSFDVSLPLARDMKRAGCTSIVLEFRFGASFPMSPPFARVVRPRFLPFAQGGGGHVTAGGAICSELLTITGWSPALSIEKVLIDIRMNLCDLDPPGRLDRGLNGSDYGIGEAVAAFRRAVAGHGWQLPSDIDSIAAAWLPAA